MRVGRDGGGRWRERALHSKHCNIIYRDSGEKCCLEFSGSTNACSSNGKENLDLCCLLSPRREDGFRIFCTIIEKWLIKLRLRHLSTTSHPMSTPHTLNRTTIQPPPNTSIHPTNHLPKLLHKPPMKLRNPPHPLRPWRQKRSPEM